MEIKTIVKNDFIQVDEETTVSEMIGLMKNYEKRTALIIEKGKYLGLVEKKGLIKSGTDTGEAKVKNHLEKTPVISENADVLETANLMVQTNLDYLPVERDKKIIGVVSSLDLAVLAMGILSANEVKIRDVKMVRPTPLNSLSSLGEVLKVMHQEKVDDVPLFEGGKIFGVISFRDIMRKFLNWTPKRDVSSKFNKMASSRSAEVDKQHLMDLPVNSFSTNNNLVMIKPENNLAEAIALMDKNRLHNLLVMEGDKLFGLLTAKNVLRKINELNVPTSRYKINFVGLKEIRLTEPQLADIQQIADNETGKLEYGIDDLLNVIIHLKAYDKGGKQKYSVNLRLEYPGRIITVAQDDWKLITAVRKAFVSAKNEVSKRFKKE